MPPYISISYITNFCTSFSLAANRIVGNNTSNNHIHRNSIHIADAHRFPDISTPVLMVLSVYLLRQLFAFFYTFLPHN